MTVDSCVDQRGRAPCGGNLARSGHLGSGSDRAQTSGACDLPGSPCFINVQLLDIRQDIIALHDPKGHARVELLLSLQEVPPIREEERVLQRNHSHT